MEINKEFLKDTFGWGFLLWLLGYGLGIILFTLVPPYAIGWVITPIAIVITIWVLLKQVREKSMLYFLGIAIVWTGLAVVLDYFFIVKAFKPADGYYKLDVYLYYCLMFFLPLLVGMRRQKQSP